ncbi:MAG TPA: VCBS domain-containing protein, partial [Allosphingosinicella sp.]
DPGTDFDHLAQGASEVVVLGYTMKDEHGATSSSSITVTITGTNDGPVANADSAATGENSPVSIAVLGNDSDADDGAVLTVTGASAPAGQGSVSVVGNQILFDPGGDFDHLSAGQSASVVVGYSIEDEHGASSSSTVTVTVNGANDPTSIDSGGTAATGSVAELPNGDPGEGMTIHQADGVVAFDDVDLADTHSATATAQGSGYFGTFTLDPVDQAGDTVAWRFDVGDSEIDGLEEGEVVTQTYTITVSDGNGGTATQEVTVTLTGAADENAWYIDNSAVLSTNEGTQANPFTSIAAFNAAQGTAGGPAEGETVYLLTGTGTYAEADGINLLDGQILIGVPSIVGRPTIKPSAGDGVNVGQGNSVSGVDIASGAGAGIADSGGSVGALSVSDVAITTTSGIAVNIDGGGSNVTIAGSTLASGSNYAILGANVAGFTLTDSVVSSASSASGTVAFTNLTGTASFLGNSLTGSGGDTLGIANSAGSLTLTIADSAGGAAVIGPNHSGNGGDGVNIATAGGSLTLVVDGVEFQGAREDLLEVSANGTSSHDIRITGNSFANGQASVSGGGGVVLNGTGTNVSVDYQVSDNSFTGAEGNALTASYTIQSGAIRGYIGDNDIGIGDGVAGSQGSAGFGDGISVSLQKTAGAGAATYVVTIEDNEIHDIAGGFGGIVLRSSGGGAADAAVLEATVRNNVVDELGDFALSALYALVGGSAASGDFARLGLVLEGNVLDAGDADYGFDAVFLDQVSSDAHFYVPGYVGSGNGEFATPSGTASADLGAFWGANNTLEATPFSLFGGVDASLVSDLTGGPLTQPAYFP